AAIGCLAGVCRKRSTDLDSEKRPGGAPAGQFDRARGRASPGSTPGPGQSRGGIPQDDGGRQQMMDSDFITVLWKELKKILLERSGGSTGSARPLILVAFLGIFMPLRLGPERFFTAFGLVAPVFFGAFVITAVIADSFAGERERHTLETLLASRLSDRSIL